MADGAFLTDPFKIFANFALNLFHRVRWSNDVRDFNAKCAKVFKRSDFVLAVVVCNSLDTFFKRDAAKIDQQSQRQLYQPQICQCLPSMDRGEPFNRFHFNHQSSLYQQVQTKSLRKIQTVNTCSDRHLPVNFQPLGDNRLAKTCS